MRDLSAADLLAAWEQGVDLDVDQRTLILLAAALPDAQLGALAQLPIGRRDAAILTLRERVFGSHLVSRATCPACGEQLELNFTVGDIQVSANEADTNEGASPFEEDRRSDLAPHVLDLSHAGYEVRFRLPDSEFFPSQWKNPLH